MTKAFTSQQTEEQKQRYLNFLKTVNLVKLSRRYYHFVANNAQDGRYNEYVYLLRVLNICAKVDGTKNHPDHFPGHWTYRSSLQFHAEKAFIKWFDNSQKTLPDSYKEEIKKHL
jgi:hypothetical protein